MRFSASIFIATAVVFLGGELIRPAERLGLIVVSSSPPTSDRGGGESESAEAPHDSITAPATKSRAEHEKSSNKTEDALASPKQLVIQVPTAMRSTPVPATIVLPSSYELNPEEKYSVVYLLHGAGATHKAWSNIADLSALAESYKVMFICPDGGRTSWYFDSPIDPTYQYETFVSKELVAHIDSNYRTRQDPTNRAVLGFSMGGHGAFYLAVRHPDVFGTAVALSGGVDIRPFPKQWEIAKRLGPRDEYPERWKNHSVMTQVSEHLTKDTKLHLALDCGVGDFFLKVNRALHDKLLEKKIEHDYAERPGQHNQKYWKEAIVYQMVFVDKHIT